MEYAIVYYNKFVKRDVIVFKNSNYDIVNKIYLMKYCGDLLTDFRLVIKIKK